MPIQRSARRLHRSRPKSPHRSRRSNIRRSPYTHPAVHLQQTIGNHATAQLLQAKLKIGPPGDQYEREADRVAEQVVGMPDRANSAAGAVSHSASRPAIQRAAETEDEKRVVQGPHEMFKAPLEEEEQPMRRQPAAEEEIKKPGEEEQMMQRAPAMEEETKKPGEEEQAMQRQPLEEEPKKKPEEEKTATLQTKSNAAKTPAVSPSVAGNINSMRGGGSPLPRPVRAYFEPRIGYDLSSVRVHTGDKAAGTARAVNARAFTVGKDIVMGTGEYSPETTQGKKLLAHELTHVVQQSKHVAVPKVQRALPKVGRSVTPPPGTVSPFKLVTASFDGKDFFVFGDGKPILTVPAQSGRPNTVGATHAAACSGAATDSYMNNPLYIGIKDWGSIPEGKFSFSVSQMATFTPSEQQQILTSTGNFVDPFGRTMHGGDWGSGRVPLTPMNVQKTKHCGNTGSRSGFFLHGGVMPGSSGCIDIGNTAFDKLVSLLLGYRKNIILTVKYAHPAPTVGTLERMTGEFMYGSP